MDPAFFIARRMAQTASGHKPGVMERIAVLSVAVGLATMIVALAVITGFKREISHKMSGFAADAAVTDIRSLRAMDASPVHRSTRLEALIRTTDGFAAMTPYAVKGGIVRTDDAVEAVVLKGVDGSYDWSFFREWLVEGELPRVGDTIRTKDVLLSRSLADRLMLGPGDRVEMLFVGTDEAPRRDRFKVAGIYSSGMEELERAVIVTDLRNVQRLSNWAADEVSGYEISLRNPSAADEFARRLEHAILYDESEELSGLAVSSVQERYADIFDWLRAHDVNAAVVIGIMLVVAFFNMASALLILVLERTRMIGLLKTFGMTDAGLRRLFLYRSAFVALRGMAWGNGAGLLLCLAQRWFHLVRLDSEGYLLSEVPVALEWSWWLPLNAGVAVAIVSLLLIPACIVSTVKPEETIRYE